MQELNEIWKIIPNFDNYEASNTGKIRHKNNKLISSNKLGRSGYIRKTLIDNNKNKINTTVHYLICTTFHGPKPSEFHTVDHIDKNKINNNENNLKWATPSEQNTNKTKKNTVGGYPIEMVDIETEEIMATFKNSAFASRILDLGDRHVISRMINNKLCLLENCYFRQLHYDDFKDEEWKKLKENFWISSYGRIKNDQNIPLNVTPTRHGYYVIQFNKKTEYVHRLVATTFIENPNNYSVVNHKDNNGLNNHINNLEWCTHEYNTVHAQIFLKKEKQMIKDQKKQEFEQKKEEKEEKEKKEKKEKQTLKVYKFDVKNKKLINTFNSIQEAADDAEINHSSMCKRINNKINVRDTMWSYTNELPEISQTKEKLIYKFDKDINLIKIYNTIEEAALEENISPSTMRRITKNSSLVGNFIYSRDENPSDITNISSIRTNKIVEKVNSDTGEIITVYNTNREAADAEKLVPNTIKYRIQKGIVKDGILFRYQ